MDSDQDSPFDEQSHEITEEKTDNYFLTIEDISLQIKYGDGDELRSALEALQSMILESEIDTEWLNHEGLISILFSRLSSNQSAQRPAILRVLRTIASQSAEIKERMEDVGYLTAVVKSLARGSEERREAVGLLVDLARVSTVRRRVGRIRGCILMLVTILNGEGDELASRDAGRLLSSLSKNTQNALHMAEAGFFGPLIQHLKEGSEMSKILMATSLARMALTDHTRASLGEDGAIEPLITMLKTGNLESKSSSISALQNLSILKHNIPHMFAAGVMSPLLQLLFSVTSSLMSLREPASLLLARISLSDSILTGKDICGQLLSLLNLSSPSIQLHILQALNNITSHLAAYKARSQLKRAGAIQLLLPFLSEPSNLGLRTGALTLLCTLSTDSTTGHDLDQLLQESNLNKIVSIIASSESNEEKAAAVGLLSNIPISEQKATHALKKANLLPILVSLMSSSTTPTQSLALLAENIASVLIRFTASSDQKMQLYTLELGIAPLLVKLLSTGTITAKSRAATSLAQLSENSCTLRKSKVSKWACLPPSKDGSCTVHSGFCSSRGGFCLIRVGAINPMAEILEGGERGADVEVLRVVSTLLEEGVVEKGSAYIGKTMGIRGIMNVVECGEVKAKEKALWILERMFRMESNRFEYGESAQLVLIDLAHKGDPVLQPVIARLLAQLELLQVQSSYFSGEARKMYGESFLV